ncbi:MAG: hypothetical protein IKN68_06855 [Spirochaetia bacterium]|nr:hypothetical protein [Spirochaetia bacterium]
MKKVFSLILVFIFFLIAGNVFADLNEKANKTPGAKAVKKDITNRELEELSRGFYDGTLYVLAKDKNWTLYLYAADVGVNCGLDLRVRLFKETEKITKDFIAKKVNEGEKMTRLINGEYIVYEIGLWEDDYYCKTPKGGFFRINKIIKSANDSAAFSGIDDFLN